jgi:L,D-transpeptidase catalytic domain
MKAILSAERRTLACLFFCLAEPFLAFCDAVIARESAQPAAPASIPLAISQDDAEPDEERRLLEAIQTEEERLARMAFFRAIAGNDGDTLRKMLNEGIDPNVEIPVPVPAEFLQRFTDPRLRYYLSKEKGFTALMFATALGNDAVVRILLNAGADPWRVTRKHKTFALWLAAKYEYIEIMRDLMGIGPSHESRSFCIMVNLSKQNASLWRNGKIELVTPISSGRRSHPTPRGRYLITNKYRYWKSTLYPAEMPFFLRLSCGDFGLHMGRVPGYPASHGCIRVPARSAKKLYASVPIGTLVEIQ